MPKKTAIEKLIFGLKVQQLRQEAGLSYQQLSDKIGLVISYLHSIEKGKKYPKPDKIKALCEVLNTDYDYLVSLEPNKKLKPIIDVLQSDLLKIFPLETFGVSTTKLVGLLVQAPEKINAFISTIIKITRNFNMQGEDFYKAALRSYQDLHDNYFEEIESKVRIFRTENDIDAQIFLSIQTLESILFEKYSIKIDRNYLATDINLKELRSVFIPEQKILYIDKNLSSAQERVLLAKEIGFQVLKEDERPFETRMLEVDSFEKLLANFHASYFSVALLLPENLIIEMIKEMQLWRKWNGEKLLSQLSEMDVSAEMLIQRMANIFPHHFGIKKLFFMRFFTRPLMDKFIVTKEMHLSQLHDPHANQLDEHYCRRWISISLIRRLKAEQGLHFTSGPIIGAQISRYLNTPNAYFCISIAKATADDEGNSTSVTIGLLMNEKLKAIFPFLADPSILTKDVHTTCERCPITDCEARAIAPVFLKRKRRKALIKKRLEEMREFLS